MLKVASRNEQSWDYFRRSLPGSIIVTSRSRQAVSNIVEDIDVVVVEHLYADHATVLFRRKLGWKVEFQEHEAEELTGALGFMPLAIVQAATYIRQRAPRVSVPQYLEAFQRSDQDQVSLLLHEAGNHRRDREEKNSILRTLQVSLDHLHQKRRSAADLLGLMSFFDSYEIAKIGLRDQDEANDKSPIDAPEASKYDDTANSDLGFTDFDDDIIVLRDYSLIRIDSERMSFAMPRLVQLAVQDWLIAKQQLEIWRWSFVRRLATIFPAADSQSEN